MRAPLPGARAVRVPRPALAAPRPPPRTSAAIRPRTLQHIKAELDGAGVPIFETQMHEREAFRAIFNFGGTVESLQANQVGGLEGAVANARAFAGEVLSTLRRPAAKRPAAAAAETAA